MKIKFYEGRLNLAIGKAYVIISAKEEDKVFYAERFIIFESRKWIKLYKSETKYPNVVESSLDDFFFSQQKITEDDIVYKVISKEFSEKEIGLELYIKSELTEISSSIVHLFRHKLSSQLKSIKEITTNDELKRIIELHESITILRNDFIELK